MITIVDTDAMLALADAKDILHNKAKKLLITLLDKNVQFYILPTTLSEFALIASHRIGLEQTKAVVAVWSQGAGNEMLEVDKDLSQAALTKYSQQTSKEESLFDCYIMAAADKFRANFIFSFDKGYKKTINKYMLAEDV